MQQTLQCPQHTPNIHQAVRLLQEQGQLRAPRGTLSAPDMRWQTFPVLVSMMRVHGPAIAGGSACVSRPLLSSPVLTFHGHP